MPTLEERTRNYRRIKLWEVDPRVLMDTLKRMQAGEHITVEGLPDDAEITGFSEHFLANRDVLTFRVCSASYPEVTPETPIGEVSVRFTSHGVPPI